MTHTPFPKIRQYRDAVYDVRYRTQYTGTDDDGSPVLDYTKTDMPTLKYRGTVKLHGTNAAVVIEQGSNLVFQSRNRVITPENDNSGFAAAMSTPEMVLELLNFLSKLGDIYYPDIIGADDILNRTVVYGEWCGKGIQAGCAIHSLPKMFVVFAIKVFIPQPVPTLFWSKWLDIQHLPVMPDDSMIKTVTQFGFYEADIDFNNDIQDAPPLLLTITDNVEKQCPAGLALGAEGIGEGVVWRCITPGFESSRFWFKVKGEKHSIRPRKDRTQRTSPEKQARIEDFVRGAVSHSRLHQGIEYLVEMEQPIDRTSTGKFLSWVCKDILNEDKLIMEDAGLKKKDVSSYIGRVARDWYFTRLDTLV